ncbi:hypothetical protein L6452_39472 [Arctium lappa]|uniref:Uncharacterized protein n=1 Tax=Arctium lappa TaxID=4217 RepID=A0ACB8XTI5_ARCLA|nr:hypothetical protein L6452_39472 [Arctium lappa]
MHHRRQHLLPHRPPPWLIFLKTGSFPVRFHDCFRFLVGSNGYCRFLVHHAATPSGWSLVFLLIQDSNASHRAKQRFMEKLDGTNFIEWFRFLRAVLRHEKKFYVLENPPPNAPVRNAPTKVRTAYDKYQNDFLIVGCLMLATMTPELLRDHENMTAWDMISSLKSMFRLQIKQERFNTVKALAACKMTERSSVSTHILKMKGYFDQLTRLGSPLGQELEIDMVLNSLPKTYKQFIKDYNMKGLNTTLTELYSLLKTTERDMKSKLGSTKPKHVLMIKPDSGIIKKKGEITKGKTHVGSSSINKGRGEIPEVAVWYNCFHHGHQMRTCPARLAEIKKQKATRARPSGLARTKVLLTHHSEFLRNDFLSRITNGDTLDLEEIQEPQRWDDG